MVSGRDLSAHNRHYSRKSKAQLIQELESLHEGMDELKLTMREFREDHDLAQKAACEVFWDWSEKTGILNTSPGAWNKLGLADLPHRGTLDEWKNVIHPDDVDQYWAVLIAYLKGDSDLYENEYRIRLTDGSYRWIHDRGLALRDQNGRVYRMAGAIGDITERKRADEELKYVRHHIELVLKSAGEGIYGLDLEGRTTFANPAAARMVGWEVEELIGKPQHAILHHTKPDGSPYPREECPIHLALKDGSVHHLDTELFWRKDGTSFPVEYVSTPIRDERGEITGAVVVFSDISKRKQAQDERRQAYERLHDAIENIADGFVLFDADDRVVMWNQRFADLYPELANMLPNKPTAEEMFRERIRVGAVGKFDIPVDEYVRWRMAMRQKQGGTPAIHHHTDGRWMRTTERKAREGGIVAISTDISELKNREVSLREAKEQAEFANRSKSEFLANMSHELRTPLNAIIGFSELMCLETFGAVGNEQYREYVQDIYDSGTHLLSLISDILDLSKIEAGQLELKEEVVDVVQAVSTCRRIIEGRASEAGLILAFQLSSDLPKLWCDERAVKQIVLNLLSNAVKFTPAEGRATVHAVVDEDGCFVLSISDTGIGIDTNDIPKVFMPFSQVDGSLSREHQGSGLGLPLVKSLVEMHSGTIELESELGNGTIVTIRFPAERVLDDSAKTKGDGVKASAAQ